MEVFLRPWNYTRRPWKLPPWTLNQTSIIVEDRADGGLLAF